MTNRKFDRVPAVDPRNDDYPVRLLWTEVKCSHIETAEPKIVTKHWDDYAYLDQGSDGACVGFGTSGELAAEPDSVPNVDNAFALGVYNDAKEIDEWPGVDYEGTSVLAGAKVAKNRGYYSGYLWATTEEDMARTVSNYGPVIIGVDWYENMMDPDSNGFLTPTGEVVGGHCVVVTGIDAEGAFYSIRNSWGTSWGDNGSAKISRASMANLIANNGDVCKPTRVDMTPPNPDVPVVPVPVKKTCGFWDKFFNYIDTGKWECP